MDEGPERVRTCGVGCLIFGALELVVDGDAARDAAEGTTEAAVVVGTCSASRAEKSMSGPKSSSMAVYYSKESRGNEFYSVSTTCLPLRRVANLKISTGSARLNILLTY